MPPVFSPIRGAQGFQQSNPSVLCVASLLGSLQLFKDAGMMGPLRSRSIKLTAHLEAQLIKSAYYVPLHEVTARYPPQGTTSGTTPQAKPGFTIITPQDPEARGSQLSLKFLPVEDRIMQKVYDELKSFGVIGDERQPDVIRLAPNALYNTFQDCDIAVACLEEVFRSIV
ncbi:hypothetical protein EW146_g5277 [Bondarzewia mesenterica]|uniref:Aminotransferase class V domain-containing protein n=1 Tax=Bondarzewia mesenterica TaxID=1095465 RepID=A0A4S4LS04_9AGAM|nr:hypothetical protein EW146_g5277 [Bondarzewia mesenterica]